MEFDLSGLDEVLAARGADGYLMDEPSTESDQYYLSGFYTPDPFVTLYDGAVHILFSRTLENERARRESRAETVRSFANYDYGAKLETMDRQAAVSAVLAEFLRDHGVESALVPPRSPARTVDRLREQGIEVTPEDDSTVTDLRATKTEPEIDHIRDVQVALEDGFEAAERVLRAATVAADGTLRYEGEVLTSDRLRNEIEATLIRHGVLQKIHVPIVACGHQAADPHAFGEGPLSAGESILIDVAPSHKVTNYHADMTRTFVVGEPSTELRERYQVTERAQEVALDTIEAGVTGAEVHDAVCDVYEEAGYRTLRSHEDAETGFIHSTGHGIGLDVHEQPRVAPDGGKLEPGHVVTIEPGLYDPEVGGVRIEDLVVVREDGIENLTDYHKEFVIED